ELDPMTDQLCLQRRCRPIDSLLRRPLSQVGRDFEYDFLGLAGAFVLCNQNVNVTTTRAKAVGRFRTCIANVNHETLNSGGAFVGPANTIVAWLKQRIECDA